MKRLEHIETAINWGGLKLEGISYKNSGPLKFIEGSFTYHAPANERLTEEEHILRLAAEAANAVFGEIRREDGSFSLAITDEKNHKDLSELLAHSASGTKPSAAMLQKGDVHYVFFLDPKEKLLRIAASANSKISQAALDRAQRIAEKNKVPFGESDWDVGKLLDRRA